LTGLPDASLPAPAASMSGWTLAMVESGDVSLVDDMQPGMRNPARECCERVVLRTRPASSRDRSWMSCAFFSLLGNVIVLQSSRWVCQVFEVRPGSAIRHQRCQGLHCRPNALKPPHTHTHTHRPKTNRSVIEFLVVKSEVLYLASMLRIT
jgi:hypothetical protein